MQKSIFERTTRQTLKQMSCSSRRPHRVQILSINNRKLRLRFTHSADFCCDIQRVKSEFSINNIVVDHVHPCQIISSPHHQSSDEWSTILRWPPQSPDLNPVLLGCGGRGDSKISEKCLQHLIESILQRIKAVQKAKGSPVRCQQDVPTEVFREFIRPHLYFSIQYNSNYCTCTDLEYLILNWCM